MDCPEDPLEDILTERSPAMIPLRISLGAPHGFLYGFPYVTLPGTMDSLRNAPKGWGCVQGPWSLGWGGGKQQLVDSGRRFGWVLRIP